MDRMIKFYFRKFLWTIKLWYSITLKLTKVKGNRVPDFASSSAIAHLLGYGTKYKADPARGLIDIMYHPSRIMRRLKNNKPVGDCDDHAAIWVTGLSDSRLADRIWIAILISRLPTGKLSGHVLCVFEEYGEYYWCDYQSPSRIEFKWDWVKAVSSKRFSTVIAAAMIEVDYVHNDTPIFGRCTART